MFLKNLTQQEINDYFVDACTRGDLRIVKQLYKHYRPYDSNFYNNSIRKMHRSFLSLFSSSKPSLKISYDEYIGLKKACEHGKVEVVQFILSLPEFSTPLKNTTYPGQLNRALTDCVEMCLSKSHFNISDLLLPFINSEAYFEFTMQHNFLKACLVGRFDIVQHILTNKHLEKYRHIWLNGQSNEFTSSHQGFMYACENGHLKIVQYLTSSHEIPEHVDINLIERTIRVKNAEVLHYLISYYNLDKDHPFISKIDFHSSSKLNSIIEHNDYFRKIKISK